jgi:hypothetical protein
VVSVVVDLARYRSKGMLTTARELFVMVSKGQVAGFRFQVLLKDGRRKSVSAGTPIDGGENEDCGCADSCSRRVRK